MFRAIVVAGLVVADKGGFYGPLFVMKKIKYTAPCWYVF